MITIKDKREIELMKHAGLLVSKMHKFIKPYIKEGITTKELDKLCYDFIKKNHENDSFSHAYIVESKNYNNLDLFLQFFGLGW